MKEGEVADSKRGGRSDDDEFDNAELDEFDDDADELDDDEAYDDESDDDVVDEDEDDTPVASRARSRTAAKAKSATATKVARPKKKSKDDVGPGIIGRLIRFVREVVAELQKVIWPTRKELLTYTTVVVVFVAIMMSFVAGLDYAFARAMFLVFGNNK